MRIHIANDKSALVDLIREYLSTILIERRVDLIINGTKTTGIITELQLEDSEEESYLIVKLNKEEKKIPLLDETKARFGKDLVVLETRSHTTVIEVLD